VLAYVLTGLLVALAVWFIRSVTARSSARTPPPIIQASKLPPNRIISPRVREKIRKRRELGATTQPTVEAATARPGKGRTRVDIQAEKLAREEIKAACLALLDAVAIEHPAGHSKHIARYILRSQSGERIEMMFEKGEKSRSNLWLAGIHTEGLMDGSIEVRAYPASDLYRAAEPGESPTYGRHAGLKVMRDLANADLVRFTVTRTAELERIIKRVSAL
jgi:hypothetical protein